jgi:hypothetical protein
MKQLNICFFDSNHAKIIWRNVHIATGLTPPKSVSHMLRNELITGIRKKERLLISVGVVALMWAIWCTHNELVSERK